MTDLPHTAIQRRLDAAWRFERQAVELAKELAAWRALADDLAAFIGKPVRAYIAIPNTGPDADTYTVQFDEAWKAERDAELARYREAREQ